MYFTNDNQFIFIYFSILNIINFIISNTFFIYNNSNNKFTSFINKSDASNNNHIKKITNVYTSKVYNHNSGFDFNHVYKIDGIMIGYDFDFEYANYNNNFNNDTLFCIIQINGYISLEGMYSNYRDEVAAYFNLKSHYNSILYL